MTCPYAHKDAGTAAHPELVRLRSKGGKWIAAQCPVCHRVWATDWGVRGRELQHETAAERRVKMMEALQ